MITKLAVGRNHGTHVEHPKSLVKKLVVDASQPQGTVGFDPQGSTVENCVGNPAPEPYSEPSLRTLVEIFTMAEDPKASSCWEKTLGLLLLDLHYCGCFENPPPQSTTGLLQQEKTSCLPHTVPETPIRNHPHRGAN